MDRRAMLTGAGAGAAAALLASDMGLGVHADAQSRPAKGRPLAVKLGHEVGRVDDRTLQWLVRYGVEGVGAAPEIKDPTRIFASVDELKALRDQIERSGLKLHLTSSVLLNSTNVDREPHPAIMLAQSPQRDRDIEAFQNLIRNCALAGVPTLKYNMSILGVVRSGTVPGRGDAVYSRWNYAEAKEKGEPPPTRAGIVSADAFWERIDYFLSRVVPVANEYKVNLACHPQDPGTPIPGGWRGVDNVLGTVEGMKKFVLMHQSPRHGMNFCQGTISEDLADPDNQLPDVIRWFGSRGKIFNVHFRNIRGHRDDFEEVFWDEGSVDFTRMIKVYREVGYDGLLMPDHPIRIAGERGPGEDRRGGADHEAGAREPGSRPADGDGGGTRNETFVFAFGYIRGLIQAEQHLV